MSSRTQAERSEATRGALIGAARRLFAERGYAGVGTEEIVRAAGVTRGALYHHFDGKRDLLRAVYEQLEAEIAAQVAAGVDPGASIPETLAAGAQLFLDRCMEPEVQRIVLLDAGRAVTNPDFDLLASALTPVQGITFTDDSVETVSYQWSAGGGTDQSVGSSSTLSGDVSASFSERVGRKNPGAVNGLADVWMLLEEGNGEPCRRQARTCEEPCRSTAHDDNVLHAGILAAKTSCRASPTHLET